MGIHKKHKAGILETSSCVMPGGEGTLGISGWGCAAGTLDRQKLTLVQFLEADDLDLY